MAALPVITLGRVGAAVSSLGTEQDVATLARLEAGGAAAADRSRYRCAWGKCGSHAVLGPKAVMQSGVLKPVVCPGCGVSRCCDQECATAVRAAHRALCPALKFARERRAAAARA